MVLLSRLFYFRCVEMKKILSIFLITSVFSVLSAQNYQAFKEGEWLKYRLHYGFLNASYATIKLEKAEVKGKTVFRAIGKGKTTGFASLFFKVDDTYESFFELDSVRPVYFKRDIYDSDIGGVFRHIGFYGFDRDTLLQFSSLPASKNETKYSLEQFRAIANGIKIKAFISNAQQQAVDSPEDLDRVLSQLNKIKDPD